MKAIGRYKLYCWKKLGCGVIDSFYVIVPYDSKDAYKGKYEAMGYKVITGA